MKTEYIISKAERDWHEGKILPDAELLPRARKVKADFAAHKFRPGEYYDRFLEKLLRKYDLKLCEYYRGSSLIEIEREA